MRDKHHRYYRHMKTTAEKRSNQDSAYVRAKRNPTNLPDYWDDRPVTTTNNWKDHRKKQYREDGRGQEFHFITPSYDDVWTLTNYLEKYNIPHRVENLHTQTIKKRGVQRYTTVAIRDENDKITGFENVLLDKPIVKWYTLRAPQAYEIIWWSHKDIGAEFILNKESRRVVYFS